MEEVCKLFGLALPTENGDASELWAIARALRLRATMDTRPSKFDEAAAAFFAAAQDAALEQLPPQARAKLLSEAAIARALPAASTGRTLLTASRSSSSLVPPSTTVCAACKTQIAGDQERIDELGAAWHVPCFGLCHICASCGRSMALAADANNEHCIVGNAVVHRECAADYAQGVAPSHRITAANGRFTAVVSVLNGCRVHAGGELRVRAEMQLQQRGAVAQHWWAPSPAPATMRLRLVRKERRREGTTELTTSTTVCKAAVPHVLRHSHNNSSGSRTVDALLIVPASTPPSVGRDRAFSREYELHVKIHFKSLFRLARRTFFTVVVTAGD